MFIAVATGLGRQRQIRKASIAPCEKPTSARVSISPARDVQGAPRIDGRRVTAFADYLEAESFASGARALKKDYIPELSEVRMVRRAPERPFVLSNEDGRYIENCLRDVETAFGLEGFPGIPFEQIAARALIGQFIDWWRGLEPSNEVQQTAHARLPGAIRLLDTVSALMEELARREISDQL